MKGANDAAEGGHEFGGGGGRVDEVVGARSCEARPAALRRELGVGDRRASSWCTYQFLGGKKPSSVKLLAAVFFSVRSGCSRRVASCFWESALIWKSPQIGTAALFYRGAEWEWA